MHPHTNTMSDIPLGVLVGTTYGIEGRINCLKSALNILTCFSSNPIGKMLWQHTDF